MKKYTKQMFTILVALLSLSLFGCFLGVPTPEEYRIPEGHYRLHADFSNGTLPASVDEEVNHIPSKFKDVPIKSELVTLEAAAMEMADYLSEWTVLDFTLNSVTKAENGIIIDWSKNSTLLAGLDDRELKKEFRFFDAVTLNWFMMDTLSSTLHDNLSVSFIYYCSDGQPLEFNNQADMDAQGLTELSADEPYKGSWYYVSGRAQGNRNEE